MGKSCGSFSGAAESEKTAILFGGGGMRVEEGTPELVFICLEAAQNTI